MKKNREFKIGDKVKLNNHSLEWAIKNLEGAMRPVTGEISDSHMIRALATSMFPEDIVCEVTGFGAPDDDAMYKFGDRSIRFLKLNIMLEDQVLDYFYESVLSIRS